MMHKIDHPRVILISSTLAWMKVKGYKMTECTEITMVKYSSGSDSGIV